MGPPPTAHPGMSPHSDEPLVQLSAPIPDGIRRERQRQEAMGPLCPQRGGEAVLEPATGGGVGGSEGQAGKDVAEPRLAVDGQS